MAASGSDPAIISAAVSPYRARLYRLFFAAAAVYNIAFGVWAGLFPRSFFTWFDLQPPVYPAIWACLGMVVGVYGLGYAYAARHLDRAAPFIAIGLLGKLLGPGGWLVTVAGGEWPVRTLTLILFNDVIWWVPFALFLIDGTPVARALRAAAPEVCAAINFVGLLVMAIFLRHGTEIVPDAAERVAYIAGHPMAWRAGWSIWIASALSLVAFYAWWGSHLRDWRPGVAAVCIASIGVVCDLAGESILIGWLPRDYDRLAPAATLLTAGAANGLYTVSGIVLTLSTAWLGGPLLALIWAVWLAGAALTVFALVNSPLGIAIASGVLFVLVSPCVVWLGRALRSREAT